MRLLRVAIYIAFLGIASHFIGEAVPRKWFHPEGFLYRCRPWERNGKVYNRLKIRVWKDKLPDASRAAKDMYPKKVNKTPDAENLQRLIEETCVAECVHLVLIVFSTAVIFIGGGFLGWFCWFLCLLGNVPFILIQRFNRPRLVLALKRMETRQTAE